METKDGVLDSTLTATNQPKRKIAGHVPELTRRQQIVGPALDIVQFDIEAWRDDAGLVETTGQVDYNLAAAMIIHDLELADVTVLHHHGQELDHDLRVRPDQHLALAALLRVVDALQGIGQHTDANHGDLWMVRIPGETISDRQKKISDEVPAVDGKGASKCRVETGKERERVWVRFSMLCCQCITAGAPHKPLLAKETGLPPPPPPIVRSCSCALVCSCHSHG